MKKIILLLIIISAVYVSCQKNSDLTPAEENSQKLFADAVYNNTITSGVGNVFFEQNLIPNTVGQLIFKIGYNTGDTLAGYGKINSDGKLHYLTSTILAKKGNKELLVNEIFPEVSKSRMYTITNGKKDNMVVEVNHISKTRYSVSLLDQNWTSGETKVISITYFTNNQPVASYNVFKIIEEGGNRVWDCAEPQPTENPEKATDNLLVHLACGGPIWDVHDALIIIKQTVLKAIDGFKAAGQASDEVKAQLERLKTQYEEYREKINKSIGKIKDYKFEKKRLDGELKLIEDLINKLEAKVKVEVQLIPFAAGTDTDYDEATDVEIKLSFFVVEKSTGLPYTKGPVFIDMIFLSSTSQSVFFETKSTTINNGLVVFKFNPKTIPNYQNYTSLTATYAFSKDDFKPSANATITLKFKEPASASIISGNNQITVFNTLLGSPLVVRVKDNLGNPMQGVNVTWSISSGGGLVTSVVNPTNLNGLSSATWKLGPSGSQSVTATIKKFNGTDVSGSPLVFISASDSTAFYKAAVVGNWKVSNAETPNKPPYDLVLYANGTGTYTGENGQPPFPNGGYGMSWSITRSNGKYYLFDYGFWHPGFNQFRKIDTGLPHENLTSPVILFKTYNNLGNGLVEGLTYTKN